MANICFKTGTKEEDIGGGAKCLTSDFTPPNNKGMEIKYYDATHAAVRVKRITNEEFETLEQEHAGDIITKQEFYEIP